MGRQITWGNGKSWSATIRRGAFAAVVLSCLAWVGQPGPAGAVEKALQDPEVIGQLNRIEDYLNRISSMKSRFIQVNPDGSTWQGDLYVQRPGRFRFEYDAPNPHLLIANGIWFYHVDKKLKETNVIPLVKTPAHFLVGENISLRDELKVTKFDQGPGVMQVSVVTRDNPDLGEVTMTFTSRPLELRKWSIRDAQDNLTQITLQNTRHGLSLKPDLFKFVEQPVPTQSE